MNLFLSVESSARCLSVGPRYSQEKVQDPGLHPSSSISGRSTPVHQTTFLQEELLSLLRKGAIEHVPLSDQNSGFYSWYFVIPKRDEGLHLIFLNSAPKMFKVKMLTLKLIMSQIRSEDWSMLIDLKDAYFHVGILPEHRKFLRLAFGGEAYQYCVLPFGLAQSPCTITKSMDVALAPLCLQGIRVLNYLDDWLILAQSKAMVSSH
ncbi:hypothetical protein QTP86_017171 [Hemibagrus guttatus]|nr:hypothetical protein QTP86_017171 [Hemibagrus guttatus]